MFAQFTRFSLLFMVSSTLHTHGIPSAHSFPCHLSKNLTFNQCVKHFSKVTNELSWL